MEYRIEQLAQAAGVAVDTIRFYQGKGLLDAPTRRGRVTWYGEGHVTRLRRIRTLQQRGFTLTVIRRFLEGELESSDEALVAAVTSPADPDGLTLEELAARSGVAVPLLRSLEQAGLLVRIADGGEPRYPSDDLEALSAGLRVIEAGIPIPELIDLARAHVAAAERTAGEAVELFDRHVRERIQAEGGAPGEAEAAMLRLFDELLEASGTLVRHHFQRAVLRAARRHIERDTGSG
ncbi:MAG: MerR family transcriptional regulator [Candidatus Dormibacteraceae bacterium]